MDPSVNLQKQLELAEFILETGGVVEAPGAALELAELVTALHDWIMRGGFLPAVWPEKSLKRKRYLSATGEITQSP